MQFPTAIPTNVAAPSTTAGPSSGTVSGPGGGTAPTYSPGTAPTYSPGAAPTYSPGTTPSYSPQVAPTYTPPPSYGTGVAPGPTATFQGDIQPAPTWDPYGVPGSQQPTLLPQDPCLPAGQAYPAGTLATMQRFLQQVHLDYVWMPGSGREELGIHSADLGATFAIPFFYNQQTPLLVTPGFAVHFWNGPEEAPVHVPPRLYDAYLDAAWNPQVTPLFGGELGARIGVYSDFRYFDSDSLRYQGHGLAVLSFSPSFQVKAGVIYLDRAHIKLLPAGGIVWTPNSDVRFEILFPNPKIAKRLTTYRNTDWWLYARGEYGGGSWTVRVGNDAIPFDYNDLRCGVGLEFDRLTGCNGLFEVGVAFERKLYAFGDDIFSPNPTVYVRGALAY